MFNNERINQMFKKKEERSVWLVIKKTTYSTFESHSVAKQAYSLDEAVAFKVSLDQLSDDERETYFIATDVNNAMDKVITLHNQKVANDNK